MKAMLLDACSPIESSPLRLGELPTPVPADNEVLVKISRCGLCHTDLDEIEGRLVPTISPIILGHQVVGKVIAKGKGAGKFATQQRVGITWFYSACGKCRFCLGGNENLCDNAKWTGKDAHGGYAEYMVVPEDSAHAIPDEFSDDAAAPLLCAGVIGYRAVRLLEVANGEKIAIFGFGASAHIVIQVIAHRFRDSEVFVFTRGQEHRELAETLGAAWTGGPGDSPPSKFDKAIDFTPVGESVRNALLGMEKGGRLVINAIRKTNLVPRLDYAEALWHEKEIKSVANVTRRDAAEFLPLAAEIAIAPEVRKFDLEQANEALILIKQAKIGAAAVLKIAD